jgi:colicin import membrane protein
MDAKALKHQLAAAGARLNALQARKLAGVVDHYRALILQAIGQNWYVPGMADKTLTAELLIRLAPGGTVLDVEISKSSGDEALDRSARVAVLRSSPLPVPSKPAEFEPFRQFVLKVRPEDVVAA